MNTTRAGGLALGAATLILAAACSSKSSHTASPPLSSPPVAAPSATAVAGAAGSPATVNTTNGSLGTFLTDANGRTLYLWVADTAGTSMCYGACAKAWPPLLTTGAPAGGSGVDASKLSTTKRTDGGTQVTYEGHPLYYFVQDKAAGDAKGQGSNGFNAKWWVVSANGSAITTSAGAGSAGSTY